jgi:hypothetical protein
VTDGGALPAHIDTIERGYEYLLAYAAQGRQDETGSEARAILTAMHAALAQLGPLAKAAVPGGAADVGAWLDAVARDAVVARGALALVLAKPRISSLLVDNLNASVHLRALLTDVFLLEQSLKG